ncbi:MAG: DUF924 domain-containing protein [Alphaproteobacteria bacterium]|nr:DUF924 domain-containing protein [Alphaproteobacteria bacterium]
MSVSANEIITFWFEEHGQEDWFGSSEEFDRKVSLRFTEVQAAAARGELWDWRQSAVGRLAEILVLDQFSRQLFRGQGAAFATDPMSLTLAQEAIGRDDVRALDKDRRGFVLLPFMHSESLAVHDAARPLFDDHDDQDMLDFELLHRDLIVRFGRYPKRNTALGRQSTPEEIAYIEDSGDRLF